MVHIVPRFVTLSCKKKEAYLKPYLPNELKLAPMPPNVPHPHIDGRYGCRQCITAVPLFYNTFK
jgi:hypothetical protein